MEIQQEITQEEEMDHLIRRPRKTTLSDLDRAGGMAVVEIEEGSAAHGVSPKKEVGSSSSMVLEEEKGNHVLQSINVEDVAVEIEGGGSADGVSPKNEAGPSSMVLQEEKGKDVFESVNIEHVEERVVKRRAEIKGHVKSKWGMIKGAVSARILGDRSSASSSSSTSSLPVGPKKELRSTSMRESLSLSPKTELGSTPVILEEEKGKDVLEYSVNIEDLDPGWLSSVKQKLDIEPSIVKPLSTEISCSIHRVPQCFRQHYEKEYVPQIISIGPFHYAKREGQLKAMEQQKWKYLGALLRRQKVKNSLEKYLVAVKQFEERARNCYSEEINLDSNSFAEMMVLDACFLIELFCRAMEDGSNKHDPILRFGWLKAAVTSDLLMLENQIPFFILKHLITHMHISGPGIVEMASTFFDLPVINNPSIDVQHLLHLLHCSRLPLSTNHDHEPGATERINNASIDVPHLLHFLLYSCLPLSTNHNHEPGAAERINNASIDVPHLLHFLLYSCLPLSTNLNHEPGAKERINNASKLRESGIKFKKGNENGFLDIRFEKGVITIPPLKVEDTTNPLFLNLVAFEQCYRHVNSYFAGYAYFMDCLIDTANDVKILCQNGIIDRWLGSDEDVANLFNKIGREVIVYDHDFYLSNVCSQINRHHETNWNVWRATLMRTYFNNPWASISVIAGGTLLLLTLTQTFFTVAPKFAYEH